MAQGPHSRGALPDPGRNLGLGWKTARAPHPPGPNPAQKATWQCWPSDPIRRLSVDIGRSKPAAAAHLRNPSTILFFPFSFFTRAAAGRRLQLGSVRWRRQRLSRRRAARSGHGSRAGDLGSSLSIFPPFFFFELEWSGGGPWVAEQMAAAPAGPLGGARAHPGVGAPPSSGLAAAPDVHHRDEVVRRRALVVPGLLSRPAILARRRGSASDQLRVRPWPAAAAPTSSSKARRPFIP